MHSKCINFIRVWFSGDCPRHFLITYSRVSKIRKQIVITLCYNYPIYSVFTSSLETFCQLKFHNVGSFKSKTNLLRTIFYIMLRHRTSRCGTSIQSIHENACDWLWPEYIVHAFSGMCYWANVSVQNRLKDDLLHCRRWERSSVIIWSLGTSINKWSRFSFDGYGIHLYRDTQFIQLW